MFMLTSTLYASSLLIIHTVLTCFQRSTPDCEVALLTVACHSLNMTLPSGSSLPLSCGNSIPSEPVMMIES